jgi:acyl-CoA thioesterase
MKSPQEIVDLMFDKDSFSNWLGIEILFLDKGICNLSLVVNEAMLNGFHIAHGGIAYSLADTCLAFSANSFGHKAVTIDTSFSYLKKVIQGDKLIATSKLETINSKFAVYHVFIKNQNEEKVAIMKGTVSISSSLW